MRLREPHNRLDYTVCAGERNGGTCQRARTGSQASVIPFGCRIQNGLNHLRIVQVADDPGPWARPATQQCRREMHAIRVASFRVLQQIVHCQLDPTVELGQHLTDVPQRAAECTDAELT